MFYEFPLTIPPNTPVNDLVSVVCVLDYGVVSHIEMQFPSGCYGLAHVRVRERYHQLYPTNDGDYHSADDYVISFAESYPLVSPPYTWFFEGWNEDEIYPHTITLRVLLIHTEDTPARQMASAIAAPAFPSISAAPGTGGSHG